MVIADCGSTKTNWAEVETGRKVSTEGLNPHFATDGQFLSTCAEVRRQLSLADGSSSVYFYGAGCGDARQRLRAQRLLAEGFGTRQVSVETDMLGACRALCGHQAGLVGILGTGSNACLYDGQRILHQPVSTGYILGDQGSANHVGRMLLNDYLTQQMPSHLRHLFQESYPMTDAQLMEAVYHQPNPNRFLASLAPFAVAHLDEGYCSGVVQSALEQWYHGILLPLRQRMSSSVVSLHLVGGFAKAIESLLCHFFEGYRLPIGAVVADPMEGLLAFHASAEA